MTAYQCPRCSSRKKTWIGDDPVCGFDENGSFNKENWNCATLNALRDTAERVTARENDTTITLVPMYDVGIGILSYYKNRGRVDFFVNNFLETGTLRFACQLLGDIEPDSPLF